jgi:3-oxoacyl-[acyl-carrier protein] reductase
MNIIVNGGTRGIGKEIVNILSREKDYRIMVTGRDKKALSGLLKESKHNNLLTLTIDLSVFDTREDNFKSFVYEHFEKVDILINNAGTLFNTKFISFDNKMARRIMETNFFGPASIIRIVRPLMVSGGHIVNISSMGGYQGSVKYTGLSYYSASKAALASLSESLAIEFAGYGISVNCLALGAVQTDMFEKSFPGFKAPVSATEMAEFIVYFALKGNLFFNGKVIPVARNNP